MKTKVISLIGVFLISVFTSVLHAQTSVEQSSNVMLQSSSSLSLPEGIGMKKHILEDRVQNKVLLDIDDRSAELISDGIESIEFTKLAIKAISDEDKSAAIDHISSALGRIETVILRNPEMVSIPVRRVVRTDDIDTDLGAIKVVKESIKKSLDQNKFHIARKDLESLMSEVRIETTSIPIGTFPDVLKGAILSIEKNDAEAAVSKLSTVLNTMVVNKQYISLPCMRAEVLLEESLTIQPGHTDQIENRKLLLSSAIDQVDIAYELGQIEAKSSQAIKSKINEAKNAIGTTKFKDEVNETTEMIASIKNEYERNENVEI